MNIVPNAALFIEVTSLTRRSVPHTAAKRLHGPSQFVLRIKSGERGELVRKVVARDKTVQP